MAVPDIQYLQYVSKVADVYLLKVNKSQREWARRATTRRSRFGADGKRREHMSSTAAAYSTYLARKPKQTVTYKQPTRKHSITCTIERCFSTMDTTPSKNAHALASAFLREQNGLLSARTADTDESGFLLVLLSGMQRRIAGSSVSHI